MTIELEKSLSSDSFTCDECNNTYEKEMDNSEVLEEKDKLWPDVPLEDCGIVCDDCFKKIMGGLQ